MTIMELKERRTKVQSKVEKIGNTMEKYKISIEKKLKEIEDKGWDANDEYCRRGTEEYDESYWIICAYKEKIRDMKNCEKKLMEAKKIVKNWDEKLSKAKERGMVVESLPEVFTEFKEWLADQWIEYDKRMRGIIAEYVKGLEYKEKFKKYPYTTQEFYNHDDEWFKKTEKKNAEEAILDMYNRIFYITGEVMDWESLYYNNGMVNGIVIGKDGKAKIETIGAGGYNIQRYHLRTLISEIK